MHTRIHFALMMLFASLLLAACSDKQQAEAPAAPALSKQTQSDGSRLKPLDFKPQDPNYLRQRIPAQALAYIRVPQFFAYMSAPKGDAFTQALANKEHGRAIEALQQGISDKLLAQHSGMDPMLAFWFRHARTPVEFVVLGNEHQQALPRVLMTTQLGFSDRKGFAEFIQSLAENEPQLYLMNDKILEQGYASLASGPVSVELDYDENSRRLRLLAGMGVDRKLMLKLFDELELQTKHPMFTAEAAIDSSLQGLFVWLNIENALTMAGNTMPPQQYQKIKQSLLADARSVAAGIGVSQGKGRLKLLADFKENSLQGTLPTGGVTMQMHASGQPRMLMALALPSAAQVSRIEQSLSERFPDINMAEYEKFKKEFMEASGVGFEEVLNAFGPDVVFLQDQLGDYSAIGVRDKGLYKQVLDKWIKHGKMDYQKKKVGGITLHSLKSIPWFLPPEKLSKEADDKLLALLRKIRSHVFWIEEGDYLVFANVPQLLFDRHRYQNQVKLSSWLQYIQRQQTDASLLLGSGRVKATPSRLYYAYLQVLLLLADLTETEIDIAALPSAQDVSLPESGTYGFQVGISGQQILAELVYENNPVEFVLGQNMANVAMLGIMAAIAVPAYQDYTIRAKVQSAYQRMGGMRRWIDEYYQQHGQFPTQEAIDKYRFDDSYSDHIAGIRIEAETGRIVLTLAGHQRLRGRSLSLEPQTGPQGLRWVCSGDLRARYLPRACR